MSKSATADYLKSYFHEDVSLDQIYRYMDKLYNKQRELVQQISVDHTRKILGGSIGLMFYDVTSLYYTRKNGERLIVGYSEQRARKDAHNREKGIERLCHQY